MTTLDNNQPAPFSLSYNQSLLEPNAQGVAPCPSNQQAQPLTDVCVTHQVKPPLLRFTVLLLDLTLLEGVIKWVVCAWLPIGIAPQPLIPAVLALHHVENSGISFSLASQWPTSWVISLTGLVLLGLCVYVVKQLLTPQGLPKIALIGWACLLAGGLNNWLDRAFTNAVTDYLMLLPVSFPVFNLADVLVSVGALLLGLQVLGFLPDANRPANQPVNQRANLAFKEANVS
jgi:signal peptidase II